MDEEFIINTLGEYFTEEISNEVIQKNGEIIIKLANKDFAQIKAFKIY